MHGACCHERDCYAGESHNAAALMVNTFAALAADPTLSHGQALQSSILTMINSTQHSEWADPKYGAPSPSSANQLSCRVESWRSDPDIIGRGEIRTVYQDVT
jgi:hypothetical protein